MKTSTRLLGAALGATAIVGTSAMAANACDPGAAPQGTYSAHQFSSDHDFDHFDHFGHHHHFGLHHFDRWRDGWDTDGWDTSAG